MNGSFCASVNLASSVALNPQDLLLQSNFCWGYLRVLADAIGLRKNCVRAKKQSTRPVKVAQIILIPWLFNEGNTLSMNSPMNQQKRNTPKYHSKLRYIIYIPLHSSLWIQILSEKILPEQVWLAPKSYPKRRGYHSIGGPPN